MAVLYQLIRLSKKNTTNLLKVKQVSIGFTRRKEAVCKWNIIKHENAKYKKFLSEASLINKDDEYRLHHEFSSTLIEKSKEQFSLVVEYIQQHGNPFDISKSRELKNLTNRTKREKEDVNFLLNCLTLGKIERNEFYVTRFEKKLLKLFDIIPRTRKVKKVKPKQTKQDLDRETVKFLRTVDYARVRGFDLQSMLKSEISTTSFYLTKDGYIRKPNKAELSTELKTFLKGNIPTSLPAQSCLRALIIDFMGYARKVPVKTQNLKTFLDLAKTLWNTFLSISTSCSRLDIVFDLYQNNSIKGSERKRRKGDDAIITFIDSLDQPLPNDMKKFWPLSENKVAFQRKFIQWVKGNDHGKCVFLGECFQIVIQTLSVKKSDFKQHLCNT